MRILHITNNYPTLKHPIFGIFVKEQIDSLTEVGVDNDVFFINGREKGKMEYIKSIFRIRKFLKKKKYDIVHCHHVLSAVCFILSGHSRRFNTIVSYQNDPLNEKGKRLFAFIKKNTDAIILKNNSSIVDGLKVFYQPNGVNTDLFQPISKEKCCKIIELNIDKRYLLFVSSNFIRKEKRYDLYQKVLCILRDKYQLNNIEELKLINTERSLIPYYFNAASLHLLTSDFEGSPNSVKEAMACNIPVVSTDVGNVKEMLSGVEGSYVTTTNNAEELADLVYKVLNNKSNINSREVLIQKKLDIESVAKKIITIYKNIINE